MFECTFELRQARGELKSGSSGEEWLGHGRVVAREEGRWFVGVRELASLSHVQIDGGLGLGTLHDVKVGSRRLLTRWVNGERLWNGAIRVLGPSFL